MSSPSLIDGILNDLAPRLPIPARSKLELGQIVVEQIEDPLPDVRIIDEGNGSFKILLNSGLPKFIYRVTRAFATRMRVSSDNQAQDLPEIEELAQIIADIFWWYQKTGTPFGPSYNIREYQKQFASLLAHNAECFLLAHEFGHVVFRPNIEITPERVIEQLLWGNEVLYIGEATNHEREFMADIIALNTVMGIYSGKPHPDFRVNQLRYCGALLTFEIYNALESLGFEFSSSHPPFSDRIRTLHDHAKGFFKDDSTHFYLLELSEGLRMLFSAVIKIISQPTKHPKFYATESQSLLERLDIALVRYSEGASPQYAQFYMEAQEIFSKGYSHLLYNHLRDKFLEGVNWNEGLLLEFKHLTSESLTDVERANLKRFNMMKLLVGFFSQQSTSSGYYFLSMLDEHIVRG